MTTYSDFDGSTRSANATRLSVVLMLTGLAIILIYLAAARFFYDDMLGPINGVAAYLGDIGAAIGSLFGGEGTGQKFLRLINFAPLFFLGVSIGLIARVYIWSVTDGKRPASDNLITDQQFRGIFFEILLITTIAVTVWWLVGNTVTNLQARKIAGGFDFLSTRAGFQPHSLVMTYHPSDSFGRVLMMGLANTVVVSIIGIFFATLLGFFVGVMRLSSNWLVAKVAMVYVEVLRNIPLLIQIIVWYSIVFLQFAPDKREKYSLFFGLADVNKEGVWTTALIAQDGFWMTELAFVAAIVAIWFLRRWAKARQAATGKQFPVFWSSVAILIGLPLIVFLASGSPMIAEHTKFIADGPIFKRGFDKEAGLQIRPEFLALLIALTMYTAAFIAEIVRAGILAVSHGQTEAASALGLQRSQALRLVIIPQAMRVIIPPLTSQYLNLTKNSSLAAAIAFYDIVHVGGIVLNQAGQAVEIFVIWMAIYLTLSISTSIIMNWYNARTALTER